MLSPTDLVPKPKAPSIWSLDSGYGSNILDDENFPRTTMSFGHGSTFVVEQSIGLGIGPSLNAIDPVTTKLHVFPPRTASTCDMVLPQARNLDPRCIACQLLSIKNLGQVSRCEGCRSSYRKTFMSGRGSNVKPSVPGLSIPRDDDSPPMETPYSAHEIMEDVGSYSSSPLQDETSPIRRSCARKPRGLPRHAQLRLRAWVDAHQHDPYPDAESKRSLAEACNITEKQVSTWFTNTRARKLTSAKEKTSPNFKDEGNLESPLSSINTPNFIDKSMFPYETRTEFQETLHSPDGTTTPQSARRGKKKDYRRTNIETSPSLHELATPYSNRDGAEQGMWQCTFCFQYLTPKSWRRHEETQHRPKYQWTCLATGPRLKVPSSTQAQSICAFCQAPNPSEEHFCTSHRILECSSKPESDRTFGRPDHLRQHMKNFHKSPLIDAVRDQWRKDGPGKTTTTTTTTAQGWTCGFCAEKLATWDFRQAHMANHFKQGLTMSSWTNFPPRGESVHWQQSGARSQMTSYNGLGEKYVSAPAWMKGEFQQQFQLQQQQQQQQQDQFMPPYAALSGFESEISPFQNNVDFMASMPQTSIVDYNLFQTPGDTDYHRGDILFTSPSVNDALSGFPTHGDGDGDVGVQFDYGRVPENAVMDGNDNVMSYRYQGGWSGGQS